MDVPGDNVRHCKVRTLCWYMCPCIHHTLHVNRVHTLCYTLHVCYASGVELRFSVVERRDSGTGTRRLADSAFISRPYR